jgi:RES domain-containing protein
VEASIALRLSRVLDLTDRRLLRKAGVSWDQLIGPRCSIAQEIGLRAWESGIEALLAPSAAHPADLNLAVFLDNQQPLWEVALASITTDE